MRSYSTAQIAMILAFLSSASAHVVLKTPTPYDPTKVQTDPLGLALAFPCQGGKVDFKVGEATAVTAGTTTPVDFTGSAVHGGGSCQFSMNTDSEPSADPSKWKVLFTILGGCPADAEGNIQETGIDADGRSIGVSCTDSTGKECVRKYNIPIPAFVPNGKAHFAWTWYNKVGNREFYMNCAPIEISGGQDGSSPEYEQLPGLFVSDVPGFSGSTCVRGQSVFNIPNPGLFGAILGEMAGPAAQGNCPAAPIPAFPKAMPGAGAGPVASGAPATGAATGSKQTATAAPPAGSQTYSTFFTAPPSAAASAPQGTATPAATAAPTTMQTVQSSAAASKPASSAPPVATSAAPTPVASSAPAPAVTGSGSGSGSGSGAAGGANTMVCSTEGAVVCSGTQLWGLCDHGCAKLQPVAAGTQCLDGAIVMAGRKLFIKSRIAGDY